MRRKIHYLLLYAFLFLIVGKVSADIAGTNRVYHAEDGFVGTFIEVPDDKIPSPPQTGIRWIAEGAPTCQWNITGNLSPVSGTNQLKLVLDFSQPCSGTLSVVLFQRWVDSSDHSRLVITKSVPMAPVGIDVIRVKFYFYHSATPEDLVILIGSTVPGEVKNLSVMQTRDLALDLSSNDPVTEFKPRKVILSRRTQKAAFEITSPLTDKYGTSIISALPENE